MADRFEVDSAGTSGWHDGDPPDARSVATALGRGVTVAGRSRRVVRDDFAHWDLLIAMDAENLTELRRLAAEAGVPTGRLHRLREWDPEPDSPDVPDPYFGGDLGFERVHDIVERSVLGLLDSLIERGPST